MIKQMTLADLRRVVENTRGMRGYVPLRIVVDNPDWGRTEIMPVQDISIYEPSKGLFVLDFESKFPSNEEDK